MKRFGSEKEIHDLVLSFENARISRDSWKHAEHLTVALCYLSRHDIGTATEKMRTGILNLLTNGFGLDLSKENPYHETLTIFWMHTIDKFRLARNPTSLLDTANELVSTYDKDYPLRFYTRELLFSDRARAKYTSPDII